MLSITGFGEQKGYKINRQLLLLPFTWKVVSKVHVAHTKKIYTEVLKIQQEKIDFFLKPNLGINKTQVLQFKLYNL